MPAYCLSAAHQCARVATASIGTAEGKQHLGSSILHIENIAAMFALSATRPGAIRGHGADCVERSEIALFKSFAEIF